MPEPGARSARWWLPLLAALVVAGCSRGPAASSSGVPATGATHDPDRPLPSPIPDVVARVNGRPIHIGQILPIAVAELVKVPVEQREARRPAVVRRALQRYIDRELLVQEALARGVEADTPAIQWAYDQARREFPDPTAWADHLAESGLDDESFKAELRSQHMVAALLGAEAGGFEVTDEEARAAYDADPTAWSTEGDAPPFEAAADRVRASLRARKRTEVTERLVSRLRGQAKVETFL